MCRRVCVCDIVYCEREQEREGRFLGSDDETKGAHRKLICVYGTSRRVGLATGVVGQSAVTRRP